MSISVLMSIYHKEIPDFFNQAMESIWTHQTLKPTEIVLVEDGVLNDELYITIENWQNKLGSVLKRIPLAENGGLAKALNIGLNHCTNNYIARMDSDDIAVPDRFQLQYDFLQNSPNTDLVGGSIQEFKKDPKNALNIRNYPKNTVDAKKYIIRASPFAHPTVMFRKKIFDNGYRYSEKYKTSQDIDLWFRLLKEGYRIANLPNVLLYFRISEDFFQRRSWSKAFKEFSIYWKGILKLHGLTWKLTFPLLRLILRLAPRFLAQLAYNGHFRKSLNKV